ncbi:hypothetical protein ACFL1H_02270 [Nanoarchaeota archaeon]
MIKKLLLGTALAFSLSAPAIAETICVAGKFDGRWKINPGNYIQKIQTDGKGNIIKVDEIYVQSW